LNPEQRLRHERAAAEERVAALRADFDDIVATTELTTDDEHDPDGSTIAFERAKVIVLRDEALALVDAVDLALARLGAGTYGVCESCGGPIAPERLDALPTTRTCISCAR
jgi:DnaK suppressor protein